MATLCYLILLRLNLLLLLPNHLLVLFVLLLRCPKLILMHLYLLCSGLYFLHSSVNLVIQTLILKLCLLQFAG